MIVFDWSKADYRLGFWFSVVSFTVMNLAAFRDATWMTAGISALLVWLPLLLTEHRHFQSGVVAIIAYFLIGCALSVVGQWLLPSELWRVVGVGIVTLAGVFALRFGIFWYLVGYVLIFWYVLSPLFSASIGLGETLEGHFVGCLGILIFWVGKEFFQKEKIWSSPWPEITFVPFRIVLSYAGIMSATMMIGIGVGGRILSTDPTIMAQASLNIMVPSVHQTRLAGFSRVIFGIGGAVVGFYIGVLFPSDFAYQIVIALTSFAALAFFKVNMGLLVGAFAIMFSYPFGTQGETGSLAGNERIIAEFLGIFAATIAIGLIARFLVEEKA